MISNIYYGAWNYFQYINKYIYNVYFWENIGSPLHGLSLPSPEVVISK